MDPGVRAEALMMDMNTCTDVYLAIYGLLNFFPGEVDLLEPGLILVRTGRPRRTEPAVSWTATNFGTREMTNLLRLTQ